MSSKKYTIEITKKADKALKSDEDFHQFKDSLKKLIDYLEDPKSVSKPDIKKLKGRFNGSFRLRTGKYRIVFRISDNSIFVIDIQPRGQVYKKK
jgi:mRNA-degrading endonuclease RelE of RelBE toxin-antitoxin system